MNTPASVVKKVAPAKSLQPFISEYVFRTLMVFRSQPIVKSMPLRVTGSIDFFLGDSFETIDYKSKKVIPFARCTIRGPRTHKMYQIAINGRFVSFTIKFKPSGLYRLMGMPANLFCNQAIDGQLIKPALFQEITEQLMACKNINECIYIIEPYLQLMLGQHKIYPSIAIDQMTDLIFKNKAPANIAGFLAKICLSARQLERNFVKEVGTTPKLYCNMVRFENLLHDKINFPDKNWTALAYDFNYYDQMHLIKSFQRFLGINPGDFAATNFAL
ncbi:MAG: helix-turn-helix domain-containing protein [Candidatus Pedobacter colombiensis]|uniref:Helix-turn-helix domain-containing protein n=1 Tax=Candidatus Pedobacter colombiensis TaxID=3121371 RepID=A0AAJ6B843_9SPHI|nr:helix-turn-helix domain-containing protein [Pedobacter sp.]WEK18723.1 MAG: helix-turn-helix domain-containing protein [Pedobacter sp.]